MASRPDPRNQGWLFVSPDAPAGGGGPGYFRQSTSTMSCHAHTAAPAHGSPAARRMTPQDHQRADTLRRARCVYDALCKAQSRVGPAIKEETGCALDEALSGILPAVVLMVGGLAASAALGGAAGAVIGSLASGVGAIPGAAAGAAAGAELGMLLLNTLGIGFLAVYIVQHITKVFDLATQGVREAWDAPSSPMPTSAKIDHASRSLARAVAVLIRLILEGIVLYLLAKGAAVTAQRVSEVGAKLRASKLGVRLAEYVERNWKALVENPKLNRNALGEGVLAKSSTRQSARSANSSSSGKIGEFDKSIELSSKIKRLEYKTTSGVILQSEPNKTVTILGSYRKDMHAVISELGDVKSLDFGPKTNGFNVLNVPDELYKTPEQFWTEYNKPWLDAAIERSDSIKLATKPEWQNLVKLNPTTNKLELTGYGKEISYLKKHRYAYDEITSSMILK